MKVFKCVFPRCDFTTGNQILFNRHKHKNIKVPIKIRKFNEFVHILWGGGPQICSRQPRKLILVRAACVCCHGTKCSLLKALFLFLSFGPGHFSPRRGYHRVLKFCIGFKL